MFEKYFSQIYDLKIYELKL